MVDVGRVRELGGRMRELHRQIARLQAELVQCVGEFDALQGYELDDYRSTRSWLRYELRMHPREASQALHRLGSFGTCPPWMRRFAQAGSPRATSR
jgi:hypothetical protein